jgi:hypothetical protein
VGAGVMNVRSREPGAGVGLEKQAAEKKAEKK